MILQKLYEYYQRLSEEPGAVAPQGFEKKEIPFLIILSRKGEFVDLQDTRRGEGKNKIGRAFLVPRATKRTLGIAANLFWDNPSYVFGCPKSDQNKDYAALVKRTKEQHAAFISRIREILAIQKNESVQAVLAYLEKRDYGQLFQHKDWKEIEDHGSNLSFQIAGEPRLVYQHPEVMDAVLFFPCLQA